jgi:hypothetical protein
MSDLIGTLDSDDEDFNHGESSKPSTSRSTAIEKDGELDPDFEFDLSGGAERALEAWGGDELLEMADGTAVSLYPGLFFPRMPD